MTFFAMVCTSFHEDCGFHQIRSQKENTYMEEITGAEHNRKGSDKNNINKWCPPTCSIILALAV